jgi:hypothetical protein
MHVEIRFSVGDRLIDLGARIRIDEPDIGEALGVQQLLGDKLGGMADNRYAHKAY